MKNPFEFPGVLLYTMSKNLFYPEYVRKLMHSVLILILVKHRLIGKSATESENSKRALHEV